MNLESGAKLMSVKEEINLVYQSCDGGKVLFSSAMKGIAAEQLDTRIQDALLKLQGNEVVEELHLSAVLHGILDDIGKIPGIDTLQGRRSVKMQYRGLELSVLCADPGEQCSLALRLAVRERAAIAEVLHALPGEAMLDSKTSRAWTVGASAVSKAHKARIQLTRLLAAEADDNVSGDTVLVPSLLCAFSIFGVCLAAGALGLQTNMAF